MSKGINKVILIGNLGNDPENRVSPQGTAITNVSIATSETWKDKQTGQQQERTEWHRVIFFNRLAEIAAQYLKKGSKVYIEGSLRTRKWTDNQGVERYTTEIIGSEMQMLDSRNNGGHNDGVGNYQEFPPNNHSQGAPGYAPPQKQAPQQNQGYRPLNNPGPNNPPAGFDDFDDDIPF